MSEDIFNDENVPEGAGWFKFEKVGDKVSGTLVEKYTKPAEGEFPAQVVYVLEVAKDEQINVGMSKDFVNRKLAKAREGDVVGFKFTEEIPAKTKGYSAAKSIMPYLKTTEAGDAVRAAEADFDNA